MKESTCSKCGDRIVWLWYLNRGAGGWQHATFGRIGICTRESYLRHVELGCFNCAEPKENV